MPSISITYLTEFSPMVAQFISNLVSLQCATPQLFKCVYFFFDVGVLVAKFWAEADTSFSSIVETVVFGLTFTLGSTNISR